MDSFLGVPVVIRGVAWGNLYLTEKQDGSGFTEGDEEAAVALAQWTAIALENARLYESSERRRQRAERAVEALRAARDIADAVGSEVELERVLELIVKRSRALVEARSVLIMLRDGDELVVAATAGYASDAKGHRLLVARSTSGEVFERRRPQRVTDAPALLRIGPDELGVPGARTALLVPMVHRGVGVGVLAAFDRGSAGAPFTADDEEVLRTFAASAATAVAIRRSVEADRLRAAIAAAEAERARWARELHDQTLQSLGALRVLLASAQRRNSALEREPAIGQAIQDIELETDNLRSIITDLRPALLDDLGLVPAIEALLERRRDLGLAIRSQLALPDPASDVISRELETTVYGLIQEALTNVAKHARASSVRVSVVLMDGHITIEVQDDGDGFDTAGVTSGFGLTGMRERVYLAGGSLELNSSEHGTLLQASLPAR